MQDHTTENPTGGPDSSANPPVVNSVPTPPPVDPQVTKELEGTGEPNVRLSKQRTDDALPEGLVNIGMIGIEIPNAETQLAGFYSKDASVLINQFPQYKHVQKKGSERPV
jgi:hypothetical protein